MKKNTALYFSVGLVVLLAIFILIFGMFFLNEKDLRETFDVYHLRFTQVSTLVLDDPVKINGVKLGRGIHRTFWTPRCGDGQAQVQCENPEGFRNPSTEHRHHG